MAPYCWNLFLLLCFLNTDYGLGGQVGGFVNERTIWTLKDSPYLAKMDVIVEEDGELTVEPGVVVHFPIGLGLTVNGILRAQGTPEHRIIFTRETNYSSTDLTNRDVRLTEGSSVLEGQLQLFYKGKWRSICTGPQNNWKTEDYTAICQELGYSKGEFHQWYFNKNISGQVYFPQPSCSGNETSIKHCLNWKVKQMGSGKCNNYPFIGIKCKNQLRSNNEGYWRGIWFNNARCTTYLETTNIIRKVVQSESLLQYVDIYYAGLNKTNLGTAAVEVWKVPPRMNNVTIKWSAFNGVNVSQANSSLLIENSVISGSKGHGVYINTSTGLANFQNTMITGNKGNGIHFIYHVNKFVGRDALDFTTAPVLDQQQPYPVDLLFQYKKKSKQKTNFKRIFQVPPGNVLSLHFVYIYSSVENGGEVIVRNGEYNQDYILTRFQISNKTSPPSVVSNVNIMRIDIVVNPSAEILMKMHMDASTHKIPDLEIKNSTISNNEQTGIFADNMRSMVYIENSQIENNALHGIKVVNGSGDVNVTKSTLANNLGDGLNVTFLGGRINVSDSHVGDNGGFGIAVWMNKTRQQIDNAQSTVIAKSTITQNNNSAIYIGHHWRRPLINVTMNKISHCRNKAFKLEPNLDFDAPVQNLLLTNNMFFENYAPSVFLSPISNVNAIIRNNIFRNNSKESIVVKNNKDVLNNPLRYRHTNIQIEDNLFQYNKGQWVVYVGLLENSKHSLQFSRNILKENEVKNPFPLLTSRSSAAAVMGIASPAVRFHQNLFNNPQSSYEVSCSFASRHYSINASLNYFGSPDYEIIYKRIFDCKERYNLACVEFRPFLKAFAFDTPHISNVNEYNYIPTFRNDNSMEIGGEVGGIHHLEPGTYNVVKDIYIRPKSSLTISAGAVLQFNQSAGIMVQGSLHIEGNEQNPILFTNQKEEFLQSNSTVRLVQTQQSGFIQEGLLEVKTNEEWGTICNHGWGINEASIACNQLGYILNPNDWKANVDPFPDTESTRSDIIMNNVHCDITDTDLLYCSYETVNDFENTCTHNDDVFLHCYNPSWSGVRIGMMADGISLNHVQIENAGQFDYAKKTFVAGIQLDLLRYDLNNVHITDNIHAGMQVMSTDVYLGQKSLNQLIITNNGWYGLKTHAHNFKIQKSVIGNHPQGTGLKVDPKILLDQRQDLARWIDGSISERVVLINTNATTTKLDMLRDSKLFILFQPKEEHIVSGVTLSTSNDNLFGLQVLQPIWCNSTEEVEIMEPNENTWNLKENLSEFPLKTSFPEVSISYKSGEQYFGGIILYVTVIENTKSTEPKHNVQSITIENSQIQSNWIGLSVTQYNQDIDEQCSWCVRKKNQSIEILNTSFQDNVDTAVHVFVPFAHASPSNILNSTFLFNSIMFINNSQGIVQESERLLSSRLVFNWNIQHCKFRNHTSRGVSLYLPKFSQKFTETSHTVKFENNEFKRNRNFSFNIDGHYAHVVVSDNKLFENNSPIEMITIQGMEKKIQMERNIIENNSGQSMITFYMTSQTNVNNYVEAIFKNNKITKNGLSWKKLIPENYTIATRGVQMINITNNIIAENNFKYEFLSGMQISSLQISQDVTRNWWGTPNVHAIKQKIFDFDDCNNFALANFIPFAMSSSLIEMSKENFDIELDTNRLSGRIFKTAYLMGTDKPYVIESDLTVMPEISLIIGAGVTVELYPNVHILVLGALKAQGTESKPIIFRQHERDENQDITNQMASSSHVRLCLNNTCGDHGFVELFNDTRQAWLPVCDDSFTEANAKVVCKDLHSKNFLGDVHVWYGKRYDLYEHFNVETDVPRMCNGDEASINDCLKHTDLKAKTCSSRSKFVYVSCQPDRYDSHWAGITFSVPNHEYTTSRSSSQHKNELFDGKSVLQHVEIIGGGMRYGTKISCIQGMYVHPRLNHVSIKDCAYHGITLVAPMNDVTIQHSRFHNNRGIGLNIISMQSITAEPLFFLKPVRSVIIPYEVFGMINICEGNKAINIQERVLLFFKYKPVPTSCVKTFHSTGNKKLGFRLLSFNLFDNSHDLHNMDSINLVDGDFAVDEVHVSIKYNSRSSDTTRLFKSKNPTMSVQIIADGASESYGFIAEIVTLPLSIHFAYNNRHIITGNSFMNNTLGAIRYSSIGEVNPSVEITYNHISSNGIEISQNFTTSEAAVFVDVQNTRNFNFRNNALVKNQGGLKILAGSETRPAGLQGVIANNLFAENYNHPTIDIEGRSVSTLQEVTLQSNFIAFNLVPYKDLISVKKIISIFKANNIYNNTGLALLFVQFTQDDVKSLSHLFFNDVYFNNTSTHPQMSSTFKAGSAGLGIRNSIIMNPANNFELVTVSTSKGTINATSNWWGYNDSMPISGRILDSTDGKGKITVIYKPFLQNNQTLIDEYCPPGWKYIKKSCHLYVGGSLSENEAANICKKNDAVLSYVSKTNINDLIKFVREKQANLDALISVRVKTVRLLEAPGCSAIVGDDLQSFSCDERLPFLCEWGYEFADNDFWDLNKAMFIAGGIGAFLVLFIIISLICICQKKRLKKRTAKYTPNHESKGTNRPISSTDELTYIPFLRGARSVETNGNTTTNFNGFQMEPNYERSPAPPPRMNFQNDEDDDDDEKKALSTDTDEYDDDNDSANSDEKQSLHESLPLVETNTFGRVKVLPEKRYLETSLDALDMPKKRYMETSLDNLDQ